MRHAGRIGILSLGCPRNLVDSESILARFARKGYAITDISKADIGVVNTCAFIEEAKTESIDAILDLIELKRQGRLRKIIVYGCLSERYKGLLKKELPEVDAFVGRVSLNHEPGAFSLTPKHYSYVKICEGCVNNCSYCVIPGIKGRFTSLRMDSVLKKIDTLDENKTSEINIIGQDITAYGLDLYGRGKLTGLLDKITKKTGKYGWIRLLYLHPARVTDELLDLIRDSPRICKYIDLPIQHINDRILKLMRRTVTRKDILGLIGKIRKKIPQAAIRTSVIAGFPGETEGEFRELLKFCEEVKFERLGAFVYSREEGTLAYNFKDQVPARIKKERFNEIMLLQQKVSESVNKGLLNRDMDVLIDEEEGEGRYLGRSEYDAPEVDGIVYVNSKDKLKPGDFVKVKITDTLEYDLAGEAVR